jgi:hypothetical protein
MKTQRNPETGSQKWCIMSFVLDQYLSCTIHSCTFILKCERICLMTLRSTLPIQ